MKKYYTIDEINALTEEEIQEINKALYKRLLCRFVLIKVGIAVITYIVLKKIRRIYKDYNETL